MGLEFNGDVLGVVSRPYDAGVTDSGRPFEAGVSTSINVINAGDTLRLKAAKGLDGERLEQLRTLCEDGGRVSARLSLDFAFGKLQVVEIVEATA